MSKIVSKSKFKPKSLNYFRSIEESGEELIITDRGRPVLKIIPYSPGSENSARLLLNSIKKYADPTEPVGTEDWEATK